MSDLAAAVGGFLFGMIVAYRFMEAEAVKRGFAEYDAKTGAWKWKEGV